MRSDLDALFRPRSVALIGASAHKGKMGNIALANLSKGKFRLYPVNPHEKRIMGLRCYSAIEEVPETVDLAVVSLPAEASVEPARECAKAGAKVVIVTSSGFGESGPSGERLERRLMDAIRGTDTRVLGPNTMGAFVPSSGLDTLFIPRERSARPGKGRLALVSQSGAVSVAFMEKAEASGVGLHSSIGLGNKMDIDENDLTEYLASEDAVGCIALYLESFSDGRRFMRICRMASRKKPIVILKSGRTEAGSAAARSHTGAMSSQESVVEGALRQMGVVRVFDEEELLDVARALDYVDRIRGDRVCVVASAGGFGVIAADYIESDRHGAGLKMSRLSSQTTSALSDVVPKFSSVKNPVDLTAGVTDQMYDSVLGILERDRGIDCILMSLELQPPNVTDRLVRVAERWGRDGKTPLVVSVFAGPETGRVVQRFSKRRIPAFPSIWRAVRAIGALAERGSRIKMLE